MKGFATTLVAVLGASMTLAVEPLSAYASDGIGRPVAPMVGEPFYTTVELRSESVRKYTVEISSPVGTLKTQELTGNGRFRLIWGTLPTLMTEPMMVQVTVRSFNSVRRTNFVVTPARPSTAVEWFDPLVLRSSFEARWKGAQPSSMKWWVPIVTTDSFQVAPFLQTTFLATAPYFQPIDVVEGQNSVQRQFMTSASAVRHDPSALRAITFRDLARHSASMAGWLRSETFIETQSREVGNFVESVLPSNYRTRMTPYDAARAIYLGTVRTMSYTSRVTPPSAARSLRSRSGDCGPFSSVFVAACRRAGIPARTVVGFTEGTNRWHVWAEFWLPEAGWIPVDPAYADGLRPLGDLPVYFGVIPDLNRRVATGFGFDRHLGTQRIPMLQSPAAWTTGGSGSVESSCSLEVVGSRVQGVEFPASIGG